MRIIHLFRGLHDYMVGLLNAQSSLADVHVCLSDADRALSRRLERGITVHHAAMPRVRSVANIARVARLRRSLDALEPDIVHLQSGVVWECGLMFGRRPYRTVLTVHDVVNHPTWGGGMRPPELVTRLAVRAADAVIAHGERTRARMLRRYRLNSAASKVHSLDHGVIAHYGVGSARVDVPDRAGNVLFFGRIDKYKGVEYLLEARQLLRSSRPDMTVIVAGATAKPAYVRRIARPEDGIALRLGHQTDSEVEALFRWADVLVLPYIEASQSGVLQLAMAFGVPPVATSVGGLPDVVRHGVNGLLVPPGDARCLAGAIRELLTNRTLRARVIGQLRVERDTRFSWYGIARDTLAVYHSAMAGRGESAAEIPVARS